VKGRSESLARQFDRVLRVLAAWGYVDGWALTENGERLGRLYHEADLLVAESLHAGLFVTAHGLPDIDQAAEAGICIGDERRRRPAGDHRDHRAAGGTGHRRW